MPPPRGALTTFGYIFLPLEFSTAVITFGDGALSSLVWSSVDLSELRDIQENLKLLREADVVP